MIAMTSSAFPTSSSSSSSSESELSANTPPCTICGQISQGNHFGVISCRACAAFFRRSADSKWSKMECLSRHCDGKTYHCKPCRLKRCRAVGMTTFKFQHDRDALVTSRRRQRSSPPKSVESFVGRPHFVLFATNATPSATKTFVDLKYLVGKAIDILRAGSPTPFSAETQLKRMACGSNCLKMEVEPKRVKLITKLEVLEFWEFHFLTVAKWLTNFDKFQELGEELKMKILFAVWHVWGRLDKLMATALYRNRNKDADLTDRVVGNGVLTDMLKVKAETEWMSTYPTEQVSYFLAGIRVWDLFNVIDELRDLRLTDVELTFMQAQLCFQYAGGRFGGQVGELMEEFQEGLSNDLHSYYVDEMGIERYSGRLAKMLKINKQIQENIRKHRARGEIAKVFEIFRLDFSHPEMFRDTGLV